ncbi:MAG: response regulator [Nitrospira sp.]|jgi:two-component system cell cycle sensor histidine kinase/response regulator CckA|nr:response regulator [Nitrospira sp.]
MDKRRVLIVEDETLIAMELADRLERQYYTVCGLVARGEEVISRIEEFRPDLILMDINLAGALSGIETAAALRDLVDVPVVFLTAYSDAEAIERAAKTSPYGYLLKPFNESEVRATIEMALHRHAMERLVRESERRLRALFDQAAVGVAEIDSRTGLFGRVNQRYRDIFGYAPDALSLDDIRLETDPDAAQAERQRMASLLDGRVREYTLEKRCVRPDGRTVWVHVTVSPLWAPGEAPSSYVAIAQDITERKQLEAQLLQAQKMEALGRLVGGIAHDFNNLLTGINGNAELVLGQLEPWNPIRPRLETIRGAGERAAKLTKQLLTFSRKQVVQPEVLEVNSQVHKFADILARLLGERIRLVLTLAPDAGSVKADAGQLDQVLLNLATNARDAMPDGGVLTIETMLVKGDEPKVRLVARDTGHGFSDDVRARLFDPFFTTKEQGKGTGLGLSIVYGIVSQHGGTIEVESARGRGTAFTITFPRVAAAAAAEPAPQPAGPPVPTVLLVEDEAIVRDIAAQMLTMQGYQVLEAASGAEALQRAEAFAGPIHLLLTDVLMPGMNGRELADRLKTVRPNLSVVFMSGYNQDELLRQGITGCSMMFVPKPFTSESLVQAVKGALSAQAKLAALFAIGTGVW